MRQGIGLVGTSVLALSMGLFALSACVKVPKPATDFGPLPSAVVGKQNWDDEQKKEWWTGSQGSRLIPKAWLDALEEPDSTTLFMDESYFDRFGYIKDEEGAKYPIGFAADDQSDEDLVITRLRWFEGQGDRQPWIGLNCAACHTNEITYKGHVERIDGAPALADFQGFTDALREAMRRTDEDPAKWERFSGRIVEPRRASERDGARVSRDRELLRSEFKRLLAHQQDLHEYNATTADYGHGRLDAVGHILNKVAWLTGAPAPYRGQPGGRQFRGEPDAPVSYPFIWNANQHDFVQWNGIVPNQKIALGERELDIGALVRNTSEVIGVFAEVRTRPYPGLNGYRSSVRIDNLTRMEAQLGTLMSPEWPVEFGAINSELRGKGKALFEQACASCHAPLDRRDTRTPIKAEMTPIWGRGGVGTDPGMVCNAFTFQARAGVLRGTKQRIVDGLPLGDRASTATFLQTQAIGVLLRDKIRIVLIGIRTLFGRQPDIEVDRELEAALDKPAPQDQPKSWAQRLADCKAAASSPRTPDGDLRILAYKARPLNGIWATAPYLHNGSVKSLHQLLLPPDQRDREFWVGNREFDPVHVGFADEQTGFGSWFRTHDSAGQPIRGNSNEGHHYLPIDERTGRPKEFSEEQRMQLVEYMKSL